MKLPINCCCDAGKLLGFVDVPHAEDLHNGDLISFSTCNGTLTLPKGTVSGLLISHPAIKSMDTPMEILRTIPGFEEYKGEPRDKAGRDERIKEVLGDGVSVHPHYSIALDLISVLENDHAASL